MIDIHQVRKTFKTGAMKIDAVKDTNLSIQQGETVGLVGESGSGKSTLGKMLSGLETPTDGMIAYKGIELWKKKKFKRLRPGEIQTVFQDPQSSLDPRMRVKDIILEPLLALNSKERKEKGKMERLIYLMKRVGLKEDHMNRYPHEFSGGQRQRIAIARALITDPQFMILDEPTSALDISVQAQVLNLLKELKREKNLTYIFISHNMSVIRYMCDRVAVMYKGKIVEIGPVQSIFQNPKHPYTKILLSSLPSLFEETKEKINFSHPPSLSSESACVFYQKCPLRQEICLKEPCYQPASENHTFSCHLQ
ncbi:ABC transporter ATP-binding protein [Peribacillus kribbensis]|uniref:ABC transporter ATP-binding protein n=1 Tax=Peribacillus kribbensis TaxID=356658 RepID=UPI0004079B32|nr:ABC transporter ATP-binding protein [Peribacillus kribbensis]